MIEKRVIKRDLIGFRVQRNVTFGPEIPRHSPSPYFLTFSPLSPPLFSSQRSFWTLYSSYYLLPSRNPYLNTRKTLKIMEKKILVEKIPLTYNFFSKTNLSFLPVFLRRSYSSPDFLPPLLQNPPQEGVSLLKTPLRRHGERKFEENNIITEPSSSAV